MITFIEKNNFNLRVDEEALGELYVMDRDPGGGQRRAVRPNESIDDDAKESHFTQPSEVVESFS